MVPGAADLYYMGNVKSLIEKTPLNEDITEDLFADLVAKIPRYTQESRRSKDAQLMTLLNSHYGLDDGAEPVDISRLLLATTFFRCCECHEYCIPYPDVLAHNCGNSLDVALNLDLSKDGDPHVKQDTVEQMGLKPWNLEGGISFSERAHERAKIVVNACGFNPKTAMGTDLDKEDLMLDCTFCATQSWPPGRLVMGWKKAVRV